MCRWLLRNGAAINGQNNGGSTPLHTACAHGHAPLLPFLLQQGANPSLVGQGDTGGRGSGCSASGRPLWTEGKGEDGEYQRKTKTTKMKRKPTAIKSINYQ